MEKILVMGGTTFVSKVLAKHLIKKGYIVDILTRGKKQVDYTGVREHLICDRKVKKNLQEVLKDKSYDYIYDISAYTKDDVEILLTALNTRSLKKYLFCSSGAVYKPSHEIIDENYKKGENPNWGKYGVDKLEAENFIKESKIPYIIFRPTYIYGEENNLYREFYLFDRINRNKVIPIPDGNTKTQFIHIDDLVKVFESAMNNDIICESYNVTNPSIITWEKLIKTCGEVTRKETNIKKINTNEVMHPTRNFFPYRDVTYLLDTKKLVDDHLYVPQITLNEGLKRTYSWYEKHKPQVVDVKMNKVDDVI